MSEHSVLPSWATANVTSKFPFVPFHGNKETFGWLCSLRLWRQLFISGDDTSSVPLGLHYLVMDIIDSLSWLTPVLSCMEGWLESLHQLTTECTSHLQRESVGCWKGGSIRLPNLRFIGSGADSGLVLAQSGEGVAKDWLSGLHVFSGFGHRAYDRFSQGTFEVLPVGFKSFPGTCIPKARLNIASRADAQCGKPTICRQLWAK